MREPETPAPALEPRSGQARGERRRDELVRAGTAVLAEHGWAGLTSRAIATRAGAPPGLVHYHFGGLAALKREIAANAVAEAFEPAFAVLVAHREWTAGVADLVSRSDQATAGQLRVAAELIAASVHDDDVAALMRQALAEARARLVPWLVETGAAEPEGLATLIVALLDGLGLHRLLDPGLPTAPAAAAVQADIR